MTFARGDDKLNSYSGSFQKNTTLKVNFTLKESGDLKGTQKWDEKLRSSSLNQVLIVLDTECNHSSSFHYLKNYPRNLDMRTSRYWPLRKVGEILKSIFASGLM